MSEEHSRLLELMKRAEMEKEIARLRESIDYYKNIISTQEEFVGKADKERDNLREQNRIMREAQHPIADALEHMDHADYPESIDVDYVILLLKEALAKVREVE